MDFLSCEFHFAICTLLFISLKDIQLLYMFTTSLHTLLITYIISNFYSPTLEQMCYQILSQLKQMEHIARLEDNPCCDNIWKNGKSGLTDAEIFYFCNITLPPPKSKFFYLIYPYFNLLKNNASVICCCSR